jgi:type II secretory pathway pseudopilin PulG
MPSDRSSVPMPNRRRRAGFTAIELIVVVSVIILLVSLTVPSIMPALKKGAVNDAATAIQRVCSQARQLARTRQEPAPSAGSAVKYWGVNVVVPADFPTKPAYAAVIFGNTVPSGTDDGLELNPLSTSSPKKPWFRQDMPRSAAPFKMDARPGGNPRIYTFLPKGSSVAWYYQYRTGFVIKDGSTATQPMNVGTVAVPADLSATPPTPAIPPGVPPVFGVASLDQKYVMAIAVYSIGLANIQDLPQ